MNDNKVKFTISKSLHRIQKLELKLDVVIEGEIVKDYTVGWVKVRGSQDPTYLQIATPYYTDYQEKLKDIEDLENEADKLKSLTDATLELQVRSVTAAIVDWDKDFFEEEFTQDTALELFKKDIYVLIYNQIANYMQKRENFLPLVSIQQENG